MPLSVSSGVGPQGSQNSEYKEPIKVEEKEKFVPMKNKELLQQIRKSGKIDTALKVEDIDALSELPFMKPPPVYLNKKPLSIKSSQSNK